MRKQVLFKCPGRWIAVLALVAAFFSLSTSAQQTLSGHVPPAIGRLHLQPLGHFLETNVLGLAISLPLQNEQELDDLIQQIYDPSSTNYHHYLTPEQFTARFGPTEKDYDTVVAFLRTKGLTVTATCSGRTLVDVSGSVAAVEKAFHVTLNVYRHPVENRTFFASETDPVIDPAIPISHITGLDNFAIPRPLIHRVPMTTHAAGAQPALGSGPSGEYMGKDFRAAYVPGVTLNGAGQTVALFELDGYYTNDIISYEQQAGLPLTTLANVAVNGGVKTPGSADDEVSLDIEMAISMATNLSQVIIYEAPGSGRNSGNSVIDLLQRIASDNLAKQISASWTFGADNSSYDTYYKQMAAQGQSYFEASGDDGAYYSGITGWADDTNITLVGATTLSTTGPVGAWSSETVWNWYSSGEGSAAGGGGINFNNVPIPAYQLGVSMVTNQGSTTLRNVPDVALTGDNVYVVYGNGGSGDFGGTSCAAPLWAGFTALVNQQAAYNGRSTVGFLNPAVYALGKSANYTSCFHDITTGNNTNTTVGNEWYAAPGYDLCTGWGTPNGQNLINALAPPQQQTAFTVTPSTGINAAGFAGGPFLPGSQIFALTNTTASSLKWSLINTSSWLNASASGSTLAASSATNVTLSVNASANSLAAGTYSATVTFTNSITNLVVNVPFTLQVNEPLVVNPAAGFAASAAEGGPFTVTSQNFSLTNTSTASLTWQATAPAWINLSPSSGALASGASAPVTASLNTSAASFTAGTYDGQVSFTDQPGASVQNRQFSLSIGQNIVQNGGFETGDFTGWTLNTNGFGTSVDNGSGTGISPQSGTYLAALGQSGSLGYLSQTLPTIANQSYLLSLWFNSPNVTQLSVKTGVTSNTPNQFVVSWNGTTLFNQTNILPISGWTNLQFIVTATSSSTVLQFGERADPWYLGLDNINVWPIPLPNIRNVSLVTDNALSLTWNSLTGLVYQVQYSTNLASTNWLNLNTYTATNSTSTVTNPIGGNPALFYRVLRLP